MFVRSWQRLSNPKPFLPPRRAVARKLWTDPRQRPSSRAPPSHATAVSAFVTGLYGIFTGSPRYGLLAGAAAVNSGFTAGAFFGIREFGVSPVLVSTLPWPQYSRRRGELGIAKSTEESSGAPERLSWSEMRMHQTLDSGISGAATGGILRGWKSGRRAILSGGITAAVACTLLQLAYNELGIARLKYISRLNKDARSSSIDTTPSLDLPPQPSKPVLQRLLVVLGLREVSDNEYLAKMVRTREIYLKRIAELECQIEEEKNETNQSNS